MWVFSTERVIFSCWSNNSPISARIALGVGPGAVHEHDEVVGLCRMPCYAAWPGEALWPVGLGSCVRHNSVAVAVS